MLTTQTNHDFLIIRKKIVEQVFTINFWRGTNNHIQVYQSNI